MTIAGPILPDNARWIRRADGLCLRIQYQESMKAIFSCAHGELEMMVDVAACIDSGHKTRNSIYTLQDTQCVELLRSRTPGVLRCCAPRPPVC